MVDTRYEKGVLTTVEIGSRAQFDHPDSLPTNTPSSSSLPSLQIYSSQF